MGNNKNIIYLSSARIHKLNIYMLTNLLHLYSPADSLLILLHQLMNYMRSFYMVTQ